MSENAFIDEAIEIMKQLDASKHTDALIYLRALLARPAGEPGHEIIRHAQTINFPKDDLAEIAAAIEEEFGQIEEYPDVDLDDE